MLGRGTERTKCLKFKGAVHKKRTLFLKMKSNDATANNACAHPQFDMVSLTISPITAHHTHTHTTNAPESSTSTMITSSGNASSTKSGTAAAEGNFDKFCDAKGHPPLKEMTKEVFCQEKMLFSYAHWLVFEYEKADSEPLMMRSVTQYLGRVMNEAKKQFGDDEFFSGLNEDTKPSHWYKKLMKNVERNVARRCIEAGDPVTTSPPPVARSTVCAACLAYFLVGTQEALLRRLIIAMIFVVAGRGGEAAANTWNLCTWDYTLNCLYFAWQQPKTLKQKGIVLLSDRNNHALDFYKALADLFTTGFFTTPVDAEEENDWMFPNLRGMAAASVATKISNYLKDLRPSSASTTYGKVQSMPEDVSSGSMRTGALCQMDADGVFPHRMAAVSGHDLKGFSAMWEYITVTWITSVHGTCVYVCPSYMGIQYG